MSKTSPPVCALILFLICTEVAHSQVPMQGSATSGRKLFHSSAHSRNGLSCAHCHADFDERSQPDGRIRPGHSLYNSATRANWWGKDPSALDAYPDIVSAALVCVERYQFNQGKLTAQEVLDLQTYLEKITRRRITNPLAIATAADKTGEYPSFGGGNRIKGRSLFFAACHACHPNGNAGIGKSLPRDREPSFYARKIREGDGLGAVLAGVDPNAYKPSAGKFMPFFGADRLNDSQIRHIIAYIKSLTPATD